MKIFFFTFVQFYGIVPINQNIISMIYYLYQIFSRLHSIGKLVLIIVIKQQNIVKTYSC